ncbi:bifunctional DNA primase/polymerase [Streptomyces sp. A7024]|uniref:Bifunctional DNA primase/polymerase n=1 Tax=Streptomyces coryli TaxID=1128680 RepID=A0A6G4UAC3_9ACTN|nr:bifunctional DNA primase/polymerase [Streptomyces coryli]NGN69179.1 bifunctional DNA primase/polymerase [Streptomyces coryli]
MRETPGKRRRLRRKLRPQTESETALTCATRWQWPVLPGAGLREPRGVGAVTRAARAARAVRTAGAVQASRGAGCACPYPDCTAAGAHPFEPGLLAATTDARMVGWWWEQRPDAPVLLATGGRGASAVSLPAVAGARALGALDRAGVRTGPVVATPDRWAVLVRPYSLSELGEVLNAQDWVPGTLRFHGDGGYLALPPSRTGAGPVRWEREPVLPAGERGVVAAPWLPDVTAVIGELTAACAQLAARAGQ